MAGMGPPPKDPKLRQRRNKVAGAALLPRDGPGVPAPALPEREGGWHPLVVEWWRDVWASPMACEFLKSDTHGLFVIAELREQFWAQPSTMVAAEIRLQEQRFGLSSLDRRRLQWEVARVEEAQRKSRVLPAAPARRRRDPRDFLKLVEPKK